MTTRPPQPPGRGASTRRWLALATTTWLAACAPSGATECRWARTIVLDREDRLVPATARQILAHNLKVAELCRRD